MSLLSWQDYKEGKRTEPSTKIETPAPEVPTLPEACLINTVTAEDLLEIKGIGPKTAAKIISGQPYESMEALTEVVSEPLYVRVSEWASEKNAVS